MENERASNNSARPRDDDALYAVYAPPGHASAAPPLPALPGAWSARAMFAAAFRDQRRVPLRAFLLLGLLPGLWILPADALLRHFSIEDLTLDWRLQAREAGYSVLHQLWVAVPVGGQALIGLDISRGHSPTPRRFLEGLRFTPAIFVVGAISVPLVQLMFAPTLGAPDDLDAGPSLTGMALMLALLVPVVCLGLVYALMSYPLVERRRGLIDALRQAWELLSRSLWRYVRLALLSVLFYAPGIVVYTWVYASSAFWVLLAPTVHLAWTHAYLHSSAALDSQSAAASGPSVAAQPRP